MKNQILKQNGPQKKLERYIVVMMKIVSIKDMNMSLIKSGSNILLVKKIQ